MNDGPSSAPAAATHRAPAPEQPAPAAVAGAARAITSGPRHHFFGYYGISPWNATERLYACLESGFHERMPLPGERAAIGVVELDSGRFREVGTTAAWNLQQGAMLHWLPQAAETLLIGNDLDAAAGCFRPVVLDVASGERRVVPATVGIGAVAADGRAALGLDYARLHNQRPVVGYAGAHDRTAGVRCPDDDGVWRIDLETGETDLVLSHAAAFAAAAVPPAGAADGGDPVPPLARERPLFFNHTLYNPTGTRFMVFLRYFDARGRLDSAVLTAGADGAALRCLVPWGHAPSHFDWLSADELMITVSRPGSGGDRQYVIVKDTPDGGWAGRRALAAGRDGVLVTEGHPSFSPDRRCFVFDGGADAGGARPLRLYDMAGEREIELGRYYAAPQFTGDVRCDLHPRWNRSGTQASFDSVHEGTRQVYVIDVRLP